MQTARKDFLRRHVWKVLVLLAAVGAAILLTTRALEPTEIRIRPVYGTVNLFLDESRTDGFPLNLFFIGKERAGLSALTDQMFQGEVLLDIDGITAQVVEFDCSSRPGGYVEISCVLSLRPEAALSGGDRLRLGQVTIGEQAFEIGQLDIFVYETREHPVELSVASESVGCAGRGLSPYQADYVTGPSSAVITGIMADGYEAAVPVLTFGEKQVVFSGEPVEIPAKTAVSLELTVPEDAVPEAEIFYVSPRVLVRSADGTEGTIAMNFCLFGAFLSDGEFSDAARSLFST